MRAQPKAASAVVMKRFLLTILTIVFCIHANAQRLQRKPIEQLIDEKYTTGMFRGGDAYSLYPLNDPVAQSSLTVFQYLQGRIPGLQVYQSGTFSPIVTYRFGKPAFFLDEIRVNMDFLTTINMNDIALVKVFRPPFYGGFGGANGAIAVYTRDGDEQ